MECQNVRKKLLEPDQSRDRNLQEHLRVCTSCARFADRLEMTQALLRDHHARVEPGPDFSARVIGNLARGPELMGWAAIRLLPASLALVLALLGWTLYTGSDSPELPQSAPSDDPIAWMLEDLS